jgi:hypothetical protein
MPHDKQNQRPLLAVLMLTLNVALLLTSMLAN